MDPRSQTLADPTDPDPKHWGTLRRSCADQGIKHFHQTENFLYWISKTR